MNKKNNYLCIPPAVVALTIITATEKLLFALYPAEPAVKNHRPIEALGIALSGWKKIKCHLQSIPLLRAMGTGYRALDPSQDLSDDDDGGHLASKSDGSQEIDKVALESKPMSLEEILKWYETTWNVFASSPVDFHTLFDITWGAIDIIKTHLPDGPAKTKLVAKLMMRRDA